MADQINLFSNKKYYTNELVDAQKSYKDLIISSVFDEKVGLEAARIITDAKDPVKFLFVRDFLEQVNDFDDIPGKGFNVLQVIEHICYNSEFSYLLRANGIELVAKLRKSFHDPDDQNAITEIEKRIT